MEHRFRPLKKHAQAVRQLVAQEKDPKILAEVIGSGGKGTALTTLSPHSQFQKPCLSCFLHHLTWYSGIIMIKY